MSLITTVKTVIEWMCRAVSAAWAVAQRAPGVTPTQVAWLSSPRKYHSMCFSNALQNSPGHHKPDKNVQSLMKHRTALLQIYLPGSMGRQIEDHYKLEQKTYYYFFWKDQSCTFSIQKCIKISFNNNQGFCSTKLKSVNYIKDKPFISVNMYYEVEL